MANFGFATGLASAAVSFLSLGPASAFVPSPSSSVGAISSNDQQWRHPWVSHRILGQRDDSSSYRTSWLST